MHFHSASSSVGFLTPTIEGSLTYLLDNTFVCEHIPHAWKSISINRLTEKLERRLNALGETIFCFSSSLGTRHTDILPANLQASVSQLLDNQIREDTNTDREPPAFSSTLSIQSARFPLSSDPVGEIPLQGSRA